MFDHARRDARYAIRSLAGAPAFTAVAVLTLALGIGANTAVYSLLERTLLKPLPYPDSDRLVLVWGRFAGIGLPHDRNWVSAPEFKDLEADSRSFAALAAIDTNSYNLTVGTKPIHVDGAAVSPAFFDVLGTGAMLGRTFTREEGQPGRDRVVILSHRLWASAFGAERSIAGRVIRLNGQPAAIVGVMPPAFDYPPAVEVWKPLAFTADDLAPDNRGSHGLQVIARIKPALSLGHARADMQSVTAAVVAANPQYDYRRASFAVQLTTMAEDAVGDTRSTLYLLLAAVALVLLIACGNVANLQLVRASRRSRELAVRAALGAGRWPLVRQLLIECGVLAAGGGAAAVVLTFWMLRAAAPWVAEVLPAHESLALDAPALAFTALASLATVIIFGIAPALNAAAADCTEALKTSNRAAGTPGSRRTRGGLVVAEIALSVVVLAGAGLLGRSLLRLLAVDPGFNPDGVLTFRVALPDQKYPADDSRRLFFRRALDRIRAVPGVRAAGSVNVIPLSGSNNSGTVTVDTTAVPPDRRSFEADWRPVLPGYFETMGIRLIAGRFFTDADGERAAPAAIVDETFVGTFWPRGDAVGKRLKTGGPESASPWRTIVGVVGHVRYRTLEEPSRAEVYWPQLQRPWPAQTFVVRTNLDPAALRAAAEREIQNVDPDQPIYAVRTMNEVMAGSMARRRLATGLLAAFAAIALTLAVVGVYGLTAYAVAERTRELGIRMALGAQPSRVVGAVVGSSLSLAMLGVLAGVAAAAVAARFISSMLFEIRPTDPATFGAIVVLLLAAAFAASYLPARRTTRIDPARTLREQ